MTKRTLALCSIVIIFARHGGICYSQSVQEIVNRYAQSLNWDHSVSLTTQIHAVVYQPFSPHESIEQDDLVEYSRDKDSLAFTIDTTTHVFRTIPNVVSTRTQCIFIDSRMLWINPMQNKPIDHVDMRIATDADKLSLFVNYVGLLNGYLSGNEKTVPEIMKGATKISERPQTEDIGKLRCVIVDATAPEGQFTAWISPDENYALAKLQVQIGQDNLLGGRPLSERSVSRKEGDQLVKVSLVLDHIETKNIGGVFIPIKATLVKTVQLKNGKNETRTITFDRTSVQLKPDFAKLLPFRLDVPNGTPVIDLDHQQNGVKYEWKDGNVIVSLKDGDQTIIDAGARNKLIQN